MQLKSLILTLALAILCYLNCLFEFFSFSRNNYLVAAILLKEKTKIENGESLIRNNRSFIGKNSLLKGVSYVDANRHIMDYKNKIYENNLKEEGYSQAQLSDTKDKYKPGPLTEKNKKQVADEHQIRSLKVLNKINKTDDDAQLLNPEHVGSEFNKFYNFNEAIPGLDYLGIGYDIVFGNPVGDPKDMIDPGYRAPIVELTWNKVDKGNGLGLYSSQPYEAWTRSEVTCQRSETVEELNTMSKYQHQLSVDAQLSFGSLPFYSFSASSSYEKFVRGLSNKEKKTYLMRTYCIRYRAELSKYIPWSFKLAYNQIFEYLPKTFDGLKNTTACPVNLYKLNKNCKECEMIHKWMTFFKEFGTHLISSVHLGGKLSTQVTIDKSEIEKLSNDNVDVKLAISELAFDPFSYMTSNIDTKSSSEQKHSLKETNVEKMIFVIGGKPPKENDSAEFQNWAESITKLAMPVKISLTPLSFTMIEHPALKEAYDSALTYYGRVYGMSNEDIQSITGDYTSISEKLRKGQQITYAGPPPGSVVCPDKQVVMLGWALHMNVHDNAGGLNEYHMVECKAGTEKCIGLGEKLNSKDDTRIWVICGEEQIAGQTQVIAEGKETVVAECPAGSTIGLGFGLSLSDHNNGPEATSIYACRSGMTSCSMTPSKSSAKSYVWIVCFDSSISGIKRITNIAKLGTVGKVNSDNKDNDGIVEVSCDKNETVVGGWLMEVHESLNSPSVQKSFIICDGSDHSCKLKGSGYNGGFMLGVDRHALVGYAVCSSSDNEHHVKNTEKK